MSASLATCFITYSYYLHSESASSSSLGGPVTIHKIIIFPIFIKKILSSVAYKQDSTNNRIIRTNAAVVQWSSHGTSTLWTGLISAGTHVSHRQRREGQLECVVHPCESPAASRRTARVCCAKFLVHISSGHICSSWSPTGYWLCQRSHPFSFWHVTSWQTITFVSFAAS